MQATILTVLVLLAAAPAGVRIGSPAPEVPILQWFNGGSEKSLRDFRGSVVLLAFFATWDEPSRAIVPPLAAFHRDYEKKGLRVVALSSEPKGGIGEYVKKREIPYRVGVDEGRRGEIAFGIRSVPCAFAIGPSGRVLWQGNLSQVDKAEIEKWLDLVRLPEIGEVAAALAPAKAAFEGKAYGKAWRGAAAILGKDGASEAERSDARKVQAAVKEVAESQTASAAEFEKEKEFLAAVEAHEEIAASFEGTEFAARAKERSSALERDPVVKHELAALRALRPIRAADAAARRPSEKRGVLEQYRAFAKKWKGTKASEAALELADTLWQSMRSEG